MKTCEDDKEMKMKELQSQTELVMLGRVKEGNTGGFIRNQRFISHPRKGLQEASKSGAADGAEIATLRAEKVTLNHKSNLSCSALLPSLACICHVFHGHSKCCPADPVARTPKEELQKSAAEVPVLKKSLAEVEGAIWSGSVFSKWDDSALRG